MSIFLRAPIPIQRVASGIQRAWTSWAAQARESMPDNGYFWSSTFGWSRGYHEGLWDDKARMVAGEVTSGGLTGLANRRKLIEAAYHLPAGPGQAQSLLSYESAGDVLDGAALQALATDIESLYKLVRLNGLVDPELRIAHPSDCQLRSDRSPSGTHLVTVRLIDVTGLDEAIAGVFVPSPVRLYAMEAWVSCGYSGLPGYRDDWFCEGCRRLRESHGAKIASDFTAHLAKVMEVNQRNADAAISKAAFNLLDDLHS